MLLAGVVGAAVGTVDTDCASAASSSASNTALASATLFFKYSGLNKHIALSFFDNDIKRLVMSAACDASTRETAAWSLSFSEPRSREPDGDEVRGGSESEPVAEKGVDGCSGADPGGAGVLDAEAGSRSCDSSGTTGFGAAGAGDASVVSPGARGAG